MTQHTDFDIIYQDNFFCDERHEWAKDGDFRGLSCCQGGRSLQSALRALAPILVAVHKNEPLTQEQRDYLREYLEVELRAI